MKINGSVSRLSVPRPPGNSLLLSNCALLGSSLLATKKRSLLRSSFPTFVCGYRLDDIWKKFNKDIQLFDSVAFKGIPKFEVVGATRLISMLVLLKRSCWHIISVEQLQIPEMNSRARGVRVGFSRGDAKISPEMGRPIITRRWWKVVGDPWILPCSRKSISNTVTTTVECNYRLNHVGRPRACNLERIPQGGDGRTSGVEVTSLTWVIASLTGAVCVPVIPAKRSKSLIFHFPLLIDLVPALLISSSTLIDLLSLYACWTIKEERSTLIFLPFHSCLPSSRCNFCTFQECVLIVG